MDVKKLFSLEGRKGFITAWATGFDVVVDGGIHDPVNAR
jgi:hypothetical protein